MGDLKAFVAEARWRGRVAARIGRDRLVTAVRPPRWRREAIRAVLSPRALPASLAADVARGDWMCVHDAIGRLLRQRGSRFVLDPASAPALRAAILDRVPGAARDAARLGDRLLAGRHDLLGYRDLSFRGSGGEIDWHFDPVHGRRAPMRFWSRVPYLDPAYGDHKVIWEINRHQHWLALGRALWLTHDRRYRVAILQQLTGWIAANPPLTGINWASMLELGFRSISWIWALHLLLADEPHDDRTPWLVDLLVALDRQLCHVERNLSYYFSPNTHLTGEALALYVAGRALPELAASARWARTGRAVLLREIGRQIGADGGHVERSTHYHRYTLDFYLLALLVARRTGDTVATARFGDAVGRLAPFMRAMADDTGHIPLIGDDDAGMLWPFGGPAHADVRASLSLAALVLGQDDLAPWAMPEDVYWLAWASDRWPALARRATAERGTADGRAPAAGDGMVRSSLLRDTGYLVVRDGEGGHLIFDVGPHGYLNGGHAHADALAITFSVGGRPFLIDPGTATYTMDPRLRDRLRRSASHNTVTVDGRSASEPAGPFHWASTTDARLASWRGNAGFAWAEGAHDGYAGARHRRTVYRSRAGLIVADEVRGSGRHLADAWWHFDPAWRVDRAGRSLLLARHAAGAIVWLVHDAEAIHLTRGGHEGEGGWCSPSYGQLVPAWSARATRSGDPPVSIVTWFVQGRADEPPAMEALPASGDATGATIAIRLAGDGVATDVVIRPGGEPARADRCCLAGRYRTDGRLLRVSTRGDRLTAVDLADATYLRTEPDDWLGISADGWIGDLHLSLDGDRLDVHASAAPPRLALRGEALAGVRQVILNGRALTSDAVVVPGRLVVCGT